MSDGVLVALIGIGGAALSGIGAFLASQYNYQRNRADTCMGEAMKTVQAKVTEGEAWRARAEEAERRLSSLERKTG